MLTVGRGVAGDCGGVTGGCREVVGAGCVRCGTWGCVCVGGVWCEEVGMWCGVWVSGGGWGDGVLYIGGVVVSGESCHRCRIRRGGDDCLGLAGGRSRVSDVGSGGCVGGAYMCGCGDGCVLHVVGGWCLRRGWCDVVEVVGVVLLGRGCSLVGVGRVVGQGRVMEVEKIRVVVVVCDPGVSVGGRPAGHRMRWRWGRWLWWRAMRRSSNKL